ncbi:hypothetical protein ASPVEDRAFT_149127 [Aspergillus versicolor CBS 583.65]|uniref:Rhodopsin domain-containing protein n=1 Tax=Aspergillus versicolor CBS 583.65 TaxID=1036611 RepID=A0A1L9PFD1_ASPVE|nr:uncharacterized protein ASPVEDRAFT_149127 [Aspergillus versicolor CBS 583.65]OJJ00155.1 hypothetical protein ASPVEDRAFT_149127 [Aspergillus versicolor CBS 583.65]
MFANWSPKECARWQGRLNNWFNQRVYDNVDARTRREFQALMDSFPLDSLTFDHNCLDATFGIRHNPSGGGIWELRDSELVPVSQCVLAFEQEDTDPASSSLWTKTLIRTRLSAILQFLTDINDGTVSSIADINAGYWKFEKSQVRRWTKYKGSRVFLNCSANYMLWHGGPQELDVSLVVVEAAREGNALSAMRMALPSMGMIHRARKDADRLNCSVFGIGTDGYQWVFAAIDNNSEYSWISIEWDTLENQTQIVSHLSRIMRRTAFLAAGSINIPGPSVNRVDDIDYQIWIGTVVTVVAATVAVTLRFVSRHLARSGYWWDDWVIVASLIVNWGMAATRWAQVLLFGFGRHNEDNAVESIVGYQKSFMAIQIVYFTNAVLTKSSLLLFYQRIFGIVKSFRYTLWISWFLITGYFVACVIASIAGCNPPSYIWDRFRDPNTPGGCFDEVAFFRWNGLANLLLDVLMLVLPLPMVWRMRTSRRQKVLLTGIFLMGSFVCVVSLLRIISFDVSDRRDPTYTQVPSSTWSSVEQGIGIVCACLPTLRPLRRLCACGGRFRRDSWKRSASSTSASNSNSNSNRSSGFERRGVVQMGAGGGGDGHCGEGEGRRWADYAGPGLRPGPGSNPGTDPGSGFEHGRGLDPDRDPVGAYAHPGLWGEIETGSGVDERGITARGEV